ncbi:MAG: hypothetical protein K1X75_12540 [Leptospirales bacterium]|nr:hypothetical protein [Leptospirales bacterium]
MKVDRAAVTVFKGRIGIKAEYRTTAGYGVAGPSTLVADVEEVNEYGRGLLAAFEDSAANANRYPGDWRTETPLFKQLKARSEMQMLKEGINLAADRRDRIVRFRSAKPHPKYGAIGTRHDPDYEVVYNDERQLGLLLLKALIITRDNAGARFRRMYEYLNEILAEAESTGQ